MATMVGKGDYRRFGRCWWDARADKDEIVRQFTGGRTDAPAPDDGGRVRQDVADDGRHCGGERRALLRKWRN